MISLKEFLTENNGYLITELKWDYVYVPDMKPQCFSTLLKCATEYLKTEKLSDSKRKVVELFIKIMKDGKKWGYGGEFNNALNALAINGPGPKHVNLKLTFDLCVFGQSLETLSSREQVRLDEILEKIGTAQQRLLPGVNFDELKWWDAKEYQKFEKAYNDLFAAHKENSDSGHYITGMDKYRQVIRDVVGSDYYKWRNTRT